MDAHHALDSLLGRLTNVLVNEAQLLGGVRVDVEFIKDEMESMNALIRHLTEAQHRDHQVWAWMKQVAGLTRDCEGNVELYIHYVDVGPGGGGLLGYLRGVVRFLCTVRMRHRIATRIRELKVRARDVGDRRQRYGVIVPQEAANDGGVEPAGDEEDRLMRRALLFEYAEPPANDHEVVTKGMDTLINLLQREQGRAGSDATHKEVHMCCWCPAKSATERKPAPATAAARDDGEQQVRVFCNVGSGLADDVAHRVHVHPAVATSFGCKVQVSLSCYDDARTTLAKILEEITKEVEHNTEEPSVDEDVDQLARELQEHLKGKRFLITVCDVDYLDAHGWKLIVDALSHAADGCHPGSAIIMITSLLRVALSSSYKIINARDTPLANLLYAYQARKMGAKYIYFEEYRPKPARYDGDANQYDVFQEYRPPFHYTDAIMWENNRYGNHCDIFQECRDNAFAMKMFLHLLYVNPERTKDDLQRYSNAISECRSNISSISKEVLMWCYNELPSKYRSCLLYLTIFPQRPRHQGYKLA
ncbi:unnamed protein product [Urochloa decumbens]|uniref:Disease resistance N-terminal domain-containing protein n=1 Tax=Urochloa decumbens TaxID=240449 RepID=A0ABC9AIP7_9POAL